MGRPKKYIDGSVKTTVYLPQDLADALNEHYKTTGTDKTATIQTALRQFFKIEEGK